MSTDPDRRKRGLEMLASAYGWPPVKDSPGDFFAMTVDHLFADVWTRPALSIRDRRLLLLGVLIASGDLDVVGLQVDSGYRLGELDAEQLREIVVFLAHYVGWPRATKVNTLVEELLARHEPGGASGGSQP